MILIDGTPAIYNGYQDLGLLDPDSRRSSLNVQRSSTNPSGIEGDPDAVVLTPTLPVFGLPAARAPSPGTTNKDVSPINQPNSLPDSPAITVEEIDDVEGNNRDEGNKKSKEFLTPTKTSNSAATQSPPLSKEKTLKEDVSTESSPVMSRSRSNTIKGTFNVQPASPQPLPQQILAQPMSQPFHSIGKHVPMDRGIITMVIAPSKDLLVTLTMSSVELWSAKTARGFVYFYTVIIKEGVGPPSTGNVEEDLQYNLGSGLSDVMHQSTVTNPHGWWIRNPGRFFGLTLVKIMPIESGIRCFLSLGDEVLVATQKNASIINYSWGDKVLLGSLHLSQDAAEFLNPANVMVNQMLYDPLQSLFAWLTTDGSVYIVRRKFSHSFLGGTPYQWHGFNCHPCDGTPETYATMLSINPQHHLLAAVMRNNCIHVYSYGKMGVSARASYQIRVAAQVTCLSWSNNGQCLAVGTNNKGLILYSVYNPQPDLTTAHGRFGFGEGLGTEPNDDPFSHRVHWLAWSSDDLELFVVSNCSESQKGKFYSLPLSRMATSSLLTNDNARNPTLFDSSKITMDFFVQTEHGSINPNAMSHSTQIPHTYALDNQPIKYVSRSADGQFVAVAGRRGLAHYSMVSQKWKLFNIPSQEQAMSCTGGMVWFKNALIIGCKILGIDCFQVKFFPREKNLDLSNAVVTLDLSARPMYLNLVNHWLLVYTQDNLLTFYEISLDSTGRISSVGLVQKISLEGVVRCPAIVRAVTWFPGNLRESFPKLVILTAGSLLLFAPDTDDNDLPKYRITQIADRVSHFELLDLPLAGLHFALWAYSLSKVKIWYDLAQDHHHQQPLPQDGSGDDEDDEKRAKRVGKEKEREESNVDFPPSHTFQVPFHPLRLDLNQGLIFGVDQNMHDSPNLPGIFFSPAFKSHMIFHQIIDRLLVQSMDQEAYLFGVNFEPQPYFGYGLEILLHDVLVRSSDGSPKLSRAVDLIDMFPQIAPQVIVACARKIEAALWSRLFAAVGPPINLFDRCLSAHHLDAAASCLIVLHTLEPPHISAKASRQLLQVAIQDQNLTLFHNVARFVARIQGTSDIALLGEYLKEELLIPSIEE